MLSHVFRASLKTSIFAEWTSLLKYYNYNAMEDQNLMVFENFHPLIKQEHILYSAFLHGALIQKVIMPSKNGLARNMQVLQEYFLQVLQGFLIYLAHILEILQVLQ